VGKPGPGFAILMLTIAIGAALVLAACGGDDDREPEGPAASYLKQLSALITLANVQLRDLEARHPAAFEELDPTRTYYASYTETFDRFLDAAKELPVAAELREGHDEYVAAGEALSAFHTARLADIEGATTMEEVNAAVADDPEYTAAVDRQKAACTALASIAETQGITAPTLAVCIKLP